jgi:hypothetical protein
LLGEDDANLIQDTSGNITAEGDPGVTLTRRPGTGAVLSYDFESFEGSGLCDERYSGVVVIFTRTNTLRGNISGTESDCVRLQISITGTRN